MGDTPEVEPPCVDLSRPSRRLAGDDGATLVEYALIVAVVVVASLGAIQFVTNASSDELADRGGRIGAPDVDATGATTTTTPTPPPPTTAPPPPPVTVPVAASVGDLAACWTRSGNNWSVTFSFTVEDEDSGLPAANVTIDGELRVVSGDGSVRPQPASTQSGLQGQGVITLQELQYTGPVASQDVQVELVVLNVGGTGVSYVVPVPPTSLLVDRDGVAC